MSTITRTTTALDAEVILPDASLSAEAALYKQWQDTFVSLNPIQSQVEFFQNLATKLQARELSVEVYNYWYNKVKASHPAVIDIISDTAQYADVNESTGSLYFANPTAPSTANTSLVGASINPVPGNIVTLLPTGLDSLVIGAYSTVNTAYAANIVNVVTPKDTASIARNNTAKPLIKAQLESKYGVVLDLTEIENVISGDISVPSGSYTTNIEGTTTTVDDLGSIINGQSTITTEALQAT